MPDTVRTQDELLALFADNTTGDISPQDGRDLIVSVSMAPLIKIANQIFTSTFGEDDYFRFDVAPPYQYSFRLFAILAANGATEAHLGCRLDAPNFAQIDQPSSSNLTTIDDASNFVVFPVVDDVFATKTVTGSRVGRIDVSTPGEAVFVWKCDGAGQIAVRQTSILEVWRSVD